MSTTTNNSPLPLSSPSLTSPGRKRRRIPASGSGSGSLGGSLSNIKPPGIADNDHQLVSESGINNGDVIIDDSIVKKIDDDGGSSLADDSVNGGGNNRSFLSSSPFLPKYWLRKQWTQLRIKFPILQSLEDLFMKIPPRIRKVLLVLWFGKWIFISFGVFLVTFIQQQQHRHHHQQQQQQQVRHGTGIGRFATSSAITGHNMMNRTLFSSSLLAGSTSTSGHNNNDSPVRVLYVVTSLAEYNNGRRATIKGSDRFLHLMIPVIMDGIETMVEEKTTTTTTTTTTSDGAKSTHVDLYVDLFLITAYELRPERQQLIRDRLRTISEKHNNVIGFDFWDNATPFGYTSDGKRRMNDPNTTRQKLRYNTRALARQHRYVVRDKLEYYDLFVCFEDDMRITKQHVEHFWKSSLEIERLRSRAPKSLSSPSSFVEDKNGKHVEEIDDVEHYKKTKFFGKMSKRQLERVLPGFVRVEALTNDTRFYRHIEENDVLDILPIPMDYEFEVSPLSSSDKSSSSSTTTKKQLVHYEIDPSICCHVSVEEQKEIKLPQNPQPEDLVIWETNAMAFSLRQFPEGASDLLDWSILMLGPDKLLSREEKVGGYWSGRDGAPKGTKKPIGAPPELLAQQGGWMATKEQLIRMNNYLCKAPFLPPFDDLNPMKDDGLEPHNVEFWSGSFQFFTGGKNHCNMQRVISMHPEHYSKHLVYHTANNKQKHINPQRMVKANHIFGQLNTVLKNAKRAKEKIEQTSAS